MSASERLAALHSKADGPRWREIELTVIRALPEIVAVVRAAEEFMPTLAYYVNEYSNLSKKRRLGEYRDTLAALDAKLAEQ